MAELCPCLLRCQPGFPLLEIISMSQLPGVDGRIQAPISLCQGSAVTPLLHKPTWDPPTARDILPWRLKPLSCKQAAKSNFLMVHPDRRNNSSPPGSPGNTRAHIQHPTLHPGHSTASREGLGYKPGVAQPLQHLCHLGRRDPAGAGTGAVGSLLSPWGTGSEPPRLPAQLWVFIVCAPVFLSWSKESGFPLNCV